MRPRAAALLAILAGCGGAPGTRVDRLPADADAQGYKLLPRPIHLPRGETTYDCGPESVGAVLHYWGKPEDVAILSRQLVNPRHKGTYTNRIAPLVRRKGLVAQLIPGSVATLKGAIDSGTPPIIAVRFPSSFHYYVVSGYSDRRQCVVCEERGGSKNLLPYEALDRMWRETDYWLILVERSTAAGEYETGADYEKEGNFERAEEHHRRALAADPAFHEARLGLGNCLVARGAIEEALAEYERVLKATPGDPKVRNNIAHCLAALGRELDRAERLAEEAVAAYGGLRAEAEADLAAARTDLDREARRRDLEERSIEYAYALGTLGQVRFRRERWESAIEPWTAALAAIPEGFRDFRARRHYEIGSALRKLGREAEARARFAEALQVVEDAALRKEIEGGTR
ncbi:MAG: tetratricopeptide repeat protein [Planctomycetes bacterium]|nr:tetratricopeptide repeat protein [Planctomycetota bacterium]